MNQPGFTLAFCTALLCGCHSSSPGQRFESWAATPQATGLARYQAYLFQHEVGGVLPMPALLRSGRRWQACKADEFSLPPESLQPNIVPTLRVVERLQYEGLLGGAQVASAYRNEAFNRCERGSRGSRHLSNNALDFDLAGTSSGEAERLCEWWRRHGPALKLGLGFYTERKIHIGTSGFRTWGRDFTRKTSLCVLRKNR